MKQILDKWHKGEPLRNEIIVWLVTEGILQLEAENYIGRELTDVEMNRMLDEFTDGETRFRFTELVCKAIDEVLNNADGRWDGLDEQFIKREKGKKNS